MSDTLHKGLLSAGAPLVVSYSLKPQVGGTPNFMGGKTALAAVAQAINFASASLGTAQIMIGSSYTLDLESLVEQCQGDLQGVCNALAKEGESFTVSVKYVGCTDILIVDIDYSKS